LVVSIGYPCIERNEQLFLAVRSSIAFFAAVKTAFRQSRFQCRQTGEIHNALGVFRAAYRRLATHRNFHL